MTMTNPLTLDPEISNLCDAAQIWLMTAAILSWFMGTTLTAGIEALLRGSEQRLHTGYKPEADRRNVRYRMHCDGLGPAVAR